jgi:hypothetical protein
VQLKGYPDRVFIQALRRLENKEILVDYGEEFGPIVAEVSSSVAEVLRKLVRKYV